MTEDDLIDYQPTNLKKKLYNYQLMAIKMMESLETKKSIEKKSELVITNFGIYSDIFGCGKTSTIIGLILRDTGQWDMQKPYLKYIITGVFGEGLIINKKLVTYQKLYPTLIVANSTIIHQWKNEIITTPLSFIIINNKYISDDINNFDIVLCLPQFYNLLISKYNSYAWKRFIYDEPVHSKILSMKSITSQFIWFICSSPYELLNKNYSKNHFISTIFFNENMNNDIFNNLIIKNNCEFVKKSFFTPVILKRKYEYYVPEYNKIKDLLTQEVIILIAQGEIDSVIKLLKIDCTSNISRYFIEPKKNKLEYLKIHQEKNFIQIQTIEKEIHELTSRLNDIAQLNCSICLQNLSHPILSKCCIHFFCGFCLFSWIKLNYTCPICRCVLDLKMLVYINDNCQEYLQLNKKEKYQVLLTILQNDGQYIIFSSNDTNFLQLKNILTNANIRYVYIHGTMNMREKQLSLYLEKKIQILLLHSISNCFGIDLIETSDIIFYDPIEKDAEEKIINLTYKIGRIKDIIVHYL